MERAPKQPDKPETAAKENRSPDINRKIAYDILTRTAQETEDIDVMGIYANHQDDSRVETVELETHR